MTTGKVFLNGQPCAGNGHVRFDKGEVVSAAKPICNTMRKLVNKVVDGIESVVPVIGNRLFNYEDDGSVFYTNFSSFFDKRINNHVRDESRSIKIHDSVLEFLVKGKFKLILTTSPFDVLDRALKERGVPVKSYYHRWGQQDSTNEIQRLKGKWNQNDCLEHGTIGIEDTLVYHLLGGYTGSSTNMPKDQTEFLDCLLSYQIGNAQIGNANSMKKMLSQKQILLLGSCIPNWLFLLLWYPLMRTSGIKHLFDYNCEDNSEFQTCLESLSFTTTKAMNEFLQFAIAKMTSVAQTKEFEYDVFLSYKSEDGELAEKIYKHLHDVCGLSVWYMDAREETSSPGEFYKRLALGLDNSRTFMPIIGKHYIERFIEFGTDPSMKDVDPLKEDLGLITETYMAMDKKEKIKASNGLGFYEIPVWDVDNIDSFQQMIMQNILIERKLFQGVIKYSYSEKHNVIKSYKDFMTRNWEELLKRRIQN